MPREETPPLVYSSGTGRICPDCGRPASGCACRRRRKTPPAGDGTVRVRREVKGRRGRAVTTISGVPGSEDELRRLAAELKRRCGSGGSVKDGVIELQGDRREAVIPLLEARGYRVVRAGG